MAAKNNVSCSKTFVLNDDTELTLTVKAVHEDTPKEELWRSVNNVVNIVEKNLDVAEEFPNESEETD